MKHKSSRALALAALMSGAAVRESLNRRTAVTISFR